MESRREFLKKAALLSGMAGIHTTIPESIRKALAIDPMPGTTWEDAEHIVILMQENRSFDHCFGSLSGVRGFNDPRAISLPNGDPVWLQTNQAGKTYAPFRLNIKDTKSTWMSSLPHSWPNQVGARNEGRYDQWLNEKRNGIPEYADMPLTMGYYDRRDIPFNYALADAFTVCDQHFCSSLTGTTSNRLFFWTGTIRADQNETSRAHLWNEDSDYESLHWKTFPEVLEEHDISWKMYQNEISIDVGFTEEEEAWLSNFGDNPMEYFFQYHVNMHAKHLDRLRKQVEVIWPDEIRAMKLKLAAVSATDPGRKEIEIKLSQREKQLNEAVNTLKTYDADQVARMSPTEKNLHRKAFATNSSDPDYHKLEEVIYDDAGVSRTLNLPKGDVLSQFRQDVTEGKLPTVSWLTAPATLSDHPSYAWFGAWYVSEVMDILTQNPDVWKKTIFILTYDENDGYFDHVPPFVAPHSGRPETGKVSGGMDTRVEYVTAQQVKERNGFPVEFEQESPIGLGFRVPLIVASPWSRGGFVNSEVFDHTSTLQFLEKFLSAKTGKSVREPNISDWRRTVSGDLTSIFRPSEQLQKPKLNFLPRTPFMESVYNAKFKKLPDGFKALTTPEISLFRNNPYESPFMPQQETGIKPSSALAYQLYADGFLNREKNLFQIRFECSDKIFGAKTRGSGFNVYAPGRYAQMGSDPLVFKEVRTWAFAVKSSENLEYAWPLQEFEKGLYHLKTYGPNGFYREFKGSANDPRLSCRCEYQQESSGKINGNIQLRIGHQNQLPLTIVIRDNAYRLPPINKVLKPIPADTDNNYSEVIIIDTSRQFGWYDFSLKIEGDNWFEMRYAGRVETGKSGFTDPYMGRMI